MIATGILKSYDVDMSEVPERVVRFLHTRIQNIDRLRVLLLMLKEPGKWTVERLSSRLYIAPQKVQEELVILADQRFIHSESPEVYYYNADSPDHKNVEELAELDRVKPVTLINLIYQSPPDKLKMFTDAFKLKKKD